MLAYLSMMAPRLVELRRARPEADGLDLFALRSDRQPLLEAADGRRLLGSEL